MTSYTVLTGAKTVEGSIKNWVNRSDIPSTDILTEAEAMIFETLRVREMQARSVLTFALGVQTASLPTGFLDPIGYQPYAWGGDLPFVHENALNEYRDESGALESGTPSRWTIVGETAYVDVLPTLAFSGILLCYKSPTSLSGSNEINFLTTRYPSLLRYACMAKAHEHMKTDQVANYLGLAMASIDKANASNEMWRRNQFIPA